MVSTHGACGGVISTCGTGRGVTSTNWVWGGVIFTIESNVALPTKHSTCMHVARETRWEAWHKSGMRTGGVHVAQEWHEDGRRACGIRVA
eukprot:356639-Chlamydomonas_euryale.AAC.1